ncbi:hypothetical protein LCGC14_3056400 [marine sediment metagenome]|uniref:Uncharacterized protein n=1 Tax=marine sediment metagenome TaxID=412755 RepID=A0A0F8YT02_9ZZZZ
MAYKTHMFTDCEAGCGHGAAYRVFNNKNSAVGEYCKRHADKRVRELKRAEEAVEAARRPIPTSVRIPR